MIRRPVSTSKPPTIHVCSLNENSLLLSASIKQGSKTVETEALVDCGAGGEFIDERFAKDMNLKVRRLLEPIEALNVDGTKNKRGLITTFVKAEVTVNGKPVTLKLLVTGLGKQKIILGHPWLKENNLEIDWRSGRLTWRWTPRKIRIARRTDKPCSVRKVTMEEETDEQEYLNQSLHPIKDNALLENKIWIQTKTSNSIEFHLQHDNKKEDLPLNEQIPLEYHEFLDVFDEDKADRFPESRPWDHKIELKDGFQPKSFKAYNLTTEEQTELDKFLKENLDKGYIRPSQSPMATPFFFVKKKDGKLRPCQGYRYLNEWTIKNAYPIPLISELMDKIKDAKYFTKLDIRWGYNNIRIREGD